MAVHAVQIKISVEKDSRVDKNFSINHGRPERLPARMDLDVLHNFHERLPEQKSQLSKVPADSLTERPEHVRGLYRFREEDDREKLLDSIESKVTADCKWYKVETHECFHNENPSKPCNSWTTERSKGNVPDGV